MLTSESVASAASDSSELLSTDTAVGCLLGFSEGSHLDLGKTARLTQSSVCLFDSNYPEALPHHESTTVRHSFRGEFLGEHET